MTNDAFVGAEDLRRARNEYCRRAEFRPSAPEASWHLATTVAAFLALAALAVYSKSIVHPGGFYFALLVSTAVLNGLVLFRFFVIEHDCVHGSFYPSQSANRLLGIATSFITLTPFHDLASSHLQHHRESGKLENGIGNHTVWLMSEQYWSLSARKRLAYRLVRDPFVFFFLIPVLNFLRGLCLMKHAWMSCISAILTGYFLYHYGSAGMFFAWLAGLYFFNALVIFGVHIQHTFNPAYCKEPARWRFENSALLGSSYHTTFGFGWFFFGVEHHPIHHLAPYIPVYRLRECYLGAQRTFWADIRKKEAFEAFSLTKLALFNKRKERFESFAEARTNRARGEATDWTGPFSRGE